MPRLPTSQTNNETTFTFVVAIVTVRSPQKQSTSTCVVADAASDADPRIVALRKVGTVEFGERFETEQREKEATVVLHGCNQRIVHRKR